MSAPVRLSVMGAGLIGRRHIEHVLARPEARLASIEKPLADDVVAAQTLVDASERITYRLRIECVSGGGRGAKFAETICARTGACHAGHLMTKRA